MQYNCGLYIGSVGTVFKCVSTLANLKGQGQSNEPVKPYINAYSCRKARENVSQQVAIGSGSTSD